MDAKESPGGGLAADGAGRVWPRKRLERLAGPLRGGLSIVAAAAIVAGLIEAAVLVIVARVASSLAGELARDGSGQDSATFGPVDLTTVSSSNLLWAGGGLVVLYLLTEVASGWAIARLLSRTIYGTRHHVLAAHADSPWPVKEQLDGSGLVQLATTNVSKGADTVAKMTSIVAAGFNFAVLLIAALLINPAAAVLVGAGVAALLVLSLPLTVLARRQHGDLANFNQGYAAAVQEHSAVGREVQVFGVQRSSLHHIDHISRQHTDVIFVSRWLAKINTAVFKASALGLVLVLLAIAVAVDTENVAAFAAVALILLRSISYGQATQTNWHGLAESAAWLDQLVDEVDRLEHDRETAGSGVIDLRHISGPITVDLQGVTFGYELERPVIEDFCLHIPAGSFVGVAGPSGAGKSTLAALLLGLQQPQRGELLLNGTDRTELDPESWKHRMAFVAQEPTLLRGSILDNVRFYRDDITDEAIVRALDAAHILDDIESWPQGLQTDPGTLGSRLSGGQKQRIAIARALAGQPSLLVLDEPTSALDPASELAITNTLLDLRGTVTLVVIAHRATTLNGADQLVRLASSNTSARNLD